MSTNQINTTVSSVYSVENNTTKSSEIINKVTPLNSESQIDVVVVVCSIIIVSVTLIFIITIWFIIFKNEKNKKYVYSDNANSYESNHKVEFVLNSICKDENDVVIGNELIDLSKSRINLNHENNDNKKEYCFNNNSEIYQIRVDISAYVKNLEIKGMKDQEMILEDMRHLFGLE